MTARHLNRRAPAGHVPRPCARTIGRGVDTPRALEPALAPLLEAIPGPAILLDERGRIMRANAAADALLAEADGLSVRYAGAMWLVADDGQQDRALWLAIRTAIAVAAGRDDDWIGTVRIARRSGPAPLVVLTTPLPSTLHPRGPAAGSQARVLVQVLGARPLAERQGRALQRVFGLTTAEARVAVAIGGGLAAPAAAATLGVSVTTVKSHLDRCFDKMEVRSQVELARLIAVIPR